MAGDIKEIKPIRHHGLFYVLLRAKQLIILSLITVLICVDLGLLRFFR